VLSILLVCVRVNGCRGGHAEIRAHTHTHTHTHTGEGKVELLPAIDTLLIVLLTTVLLIVVRVRGAVCVGGLVVPWLAIMHRWLPVWGGGEKR
jgi:hypothetical protein